MSWLSRLVSKKEPASLPADPDEPPAWAVELIEASQKIARSQAKATARVEALDAKLEGGFADLRSAVAAVARPAV
ncbi:MAG TPA: hypothetical protein VEL05_12695, partial [Candidatus Acidoferrum sp.]|nr:hypothetical protein [Candidatus Acidoferrum sp.]